MSAAPTVLLAQELGMGLWHARLLAAIARALEERGVRCVFALADPVLTRAVLRPEDRVVPAPVYVPAGAVVPAGVSTRSFADILGACGWADPAVLGALMRSWDALLDLVRPDAVVADHAPTLLLAARGRLPRISVGLGFTTPPATLERFPALHEGPPGSFAEDDVRAAVDDALAERARPPLGPLPRALDAEATFVTVMSELDPYQPLREAPALGPVGAVPPPSRPSGRAVFAYLAADDPRTVPLLTAVAALGPVRAYVRRADARTDDALRAAGVLRLHGPADIPTVLASADLVIHHGGAGLTQDAALAGRPQLLVPRHLEQQWNAHAVVRQGVGRVVTSAAPNALAATVAELRDPAATRAAASWAAIAHAQLTADAAGVIADRCRALV